MSIRVGMLLRKAVDPVKAVLKETHGFVLFDGVVLKSEQETRAGFTWTALKLSETHGKKKSSFEMKAKNEFLVAYKDGKLAARAPDIITAVRRDDGRCVSADKAKKSDKLVILGIPAPSKWRSEKGLKLWQEVLQRSGISEPYTPIERLAS
jgi:DUF917 family protein